MTRPVVAVTSDIQSSPYEAFLLRKPYVRAVEAAGALPLIVAPGKLEHAADVLQHVHGLLLTGGGDIDPTLYGQGAHASLRNVARERDVFEITLLKEALARDLPVLAVCRGQQILSVACGGRLVQDIASEMPKAIDHRPALERWAHAHEVELLQGTRIRAILGKERIAVNSTHHQAVIAPGGGLLVSARCAADGVVEGIESPRHRFVVGVQWHPEEYWDKPAGFAPLFEAWVRACTEQ